MNNVLDFTQIKNEDFKKIEKTSRNSNKNNKFPPLKCSKKTEVLNEYTKTTGLHHASKYLICKKLPKSKRPR